VSVFIACCLATALSLAFPLSILNSPFEIVDLAQGGGEKSSLHPIALCLYPLVC